MFQALPARSQRGRGLAPAVARGLAELGRLAAVPHTGSGQGCGHHGWADVATVPYLIPPSAMMAQSP